MSATRIAVEGDRPYEVVVGHDLASMLPAAVAGSLRVAVVRPIGRPAPVVLDVLRWAGHEVLDLPVPDGESAKTATVLAQCWSELGRAGFTRSDAVVGVGGGATTDLAGFVAASWLRGVRVVHVPTTLLGMVDAAVGGKTGINTAEGKNLVGAFHPPAEVLCDLDALATLPPVDLAAGLAEVIKVGFTSDPVILDLVESEPAAARDAASDVLRELVERAVRVKAAVVGADLREDRTGGLGREVLNYGHTFGHAVELAEDYRWRHGHAVAVGMVYVAELARLAGRLGDDEVRRHRAVLELVGLPTSYAGGRWDTLMPAMRVDKKARGAMLRFVVLDGIGRPGLLEGPDVALLRGAYAAVSEGES